MKIKKKNFFCVCVWGGGSGRGSEGGQGGCEWRSEAFVKTQFFLFGGGGVGPGGGEKGGQGGMVGVRVDVNGEVKFF